MGPAYDLAQLVPHRSPFLLVDRVYHADPGPGRLVAGRLLSAGDALCGMPRTLWIEALCQAAACVNGLAEAAAAPAEAAGAGAHRGYLVGLREVRFGDEGVLDEVGGGGLLVMEVQRQGQLGQMLAFAGRAVWVPGTEVAGAEAELRAGRVPAGARVVVEGRLLFAVTFA